MVLYDNGKRDPVSNNPSPNIQIVNTSSMSIPLADLEARYYFNADNLHGQTQILDVDWASIGASNVQGSFVHLTGDAYYLQLHFSPAAGQLAPRGGSAEIKMRIHKPDWSAYNQGEDFSFGSATSYTAWPRIPLFEAGRLIWGEVPR